MPSKAPSLEATQAYQKQLQANREVRQLHEALSAFFGANRHCTNCENFNGHTEVCKLANARPPAKIIVSGCERWVDDIPF